MMVRFHKMHGLGNDFVVIDARETPFEALVAASGKCIEGVPGMGFVIARRESLERSAGNTHSLAMDLLDQWQQALSAKRKPR